jgi:hypothetical protein
MVPGLPRMVPELCNPQSTPAIAGWLGPVASRGAVQALEAYRVRPARSRA